MDSRVSITAIIATIVISIIAATTIIAREIGILIITTMRMLDEEQT